MNFHVARVAPKKADFRPALPLCFKSGITEMQMSKAYFEKLKDPRWQKKRLETLERSGWSCEVCGDTEESLHVHHKQYFKGREPWDYEIGQLAVLCKCCHEESHDEEDPLLFAASFVVMDGPCSRQTVASLIAGFCNHGLDRSYASPDPDSYVSGDLASALFSWSSNSLGIDEKLRLIEIARTDMAGLTACLREFIKSKD